MARKRRTTQKNNIVIVCEGTDTEVKYFTDLKNYIESRFPDRFSDIRIVPTRQEYLETSTRNKNKKMKWSHPWAYYVQEEDNETDYNTYKSQPTRYVREAELFLDNDGYMEAWAIYDHDSFPDHPFAARHAKDTGVNVAFSSISFEEWILAHFERNPKGFTKSVCKENKQDIECGTASHINDCHGKVCIGGYIRENKHIPDYGKNMDGLFSRLFMKHKVAMINAAWTRSLHRDGPKEFWECNPYTTVDTLVARLFGYERMFSWIYSTDNFELGHTKLGVSNRVVTNIGESSTAFIYLLFDKNMDEIETCQSGLLSPGQTVALQIPDNAMYIGFVDSGDVKIAQI